MPSRTINLFEQSFDDERSPVFRAPDDYMGLAKEEELTDDAVNELVEGAMLELPVLIRDDIRFEFEPIGDQISVTMKIPVSGRAHLLALRPPSGPTPAKVPVQLTDDIEWKDTDDPADARFDRPGIRYKFTVDSSATDEQIMAQARQFVATVESGIRALEPSVEDYNRGVNARIRSLASRRLLALKRSVELGKQMGPGLI